jgi:hypothetical protein
MATWSVDQNLLKALKAIFYFILDGEWNFNGGGSSV